MNAVARTMRVLAHEADTTNSSRRFWGAKRTSARVLFPIKHFSIVWIVDTEVALHDGVALRSVPGAGALLNAAASLELSSHVKQEVVGRFVFALANRHDV